MISMVVSIFAAYSCLGCVPMETDVQHSVGVQTVVDRNGAIETSFVPKGEEKYGALSVRSDFASDSWASNVHIAKAHAYNSTLVMPGELKEAVREELAASWSFSAPAGNTGFNMTLTPHAGIERSHDSRTTRAGAEVRIEQIVSSLDQRGTFARVDSWYMFIGADGEALCWDVGDKGANFNGVALRDQVTVGDLQAGVALHKAGGELSFGYVRRETDFQSIKTVDNFAAVTFTMRR